MFRNLVVVVAVFGLGWGASFGAGMAYGKRTTPAAQAAVIPGAAAAQLAPAGQASQGGPAGQARATTLGIIDRVDGRTLTVTGPTNQQVKVTVTDQTQITKQASGALADLAAGTRITVQPQGQPAADGTVTAAIVSIVSESSFGALGGQQGQQGGQQREGGQAGR